ncbi:26S proteasome regulatory subunit rpn2 [Taphrina deformans PYCC 5710]|uniref:26S proteasome regulatory subunit RPN2 n=1 Tax=Taphrina deformans (strain PYCC 5710 / ATCC 11124 / CBS 356.35 / IMI 108563 / JCM 9778 / NBRC 8474) TaxID=1097556 RepID=R4XB38_TAPDE|nr:26S proteasome regulatory subunit rpn2 [Taphrina deformans PYCC 5710]|eukprot:CCG82810.1 26S proteasome regulatory subunit rpn2 [Taphrina deformans PYCC 5710]
MVGTTLGPSGLVSLLHGDNVQLQGFALTKLNEVVDQYWPDISDDVTSIEILYEDPDFPQRNLAALVASKVYYHLGDYSQSTTYALGAGDLFDISSKDEFVETIVSHCIDTFVQNQAKSYSSGDFDSYEADPKQSSRLAVVVDKMLQRCYADREYKQAIGIALEAKRTDILRRTIDESKDDNLLTYVLDTSIDVVQDLDFRNDILRLLLENFTNQIEPDYFSTIKCVVHLNDPSTAASLLSNLIAKNDEHSLLTAYQMAFDLESSSTQQFLQRLLAALPEATSDTGAKAGDENTAKIQSNIREILSGTKSIKLHLEFLYRNNKADIAILNKIRDSLEARNSIFHSGVTFANAFMNAGTTADGFFRDNLEWLSKASNWSKFSATAALGVIHKGHLNQGMTLLGPYLPQEGVTGSPYSEGGSLYALGLIHANHGGPTIEFLRNEFSKTTDETIQHGAALGLGVAAMGSGDDDTYEVLKGVLFGDSAIAGEATGLAMGLVMLGTGSEKAIEEMVQYAHETQHEKIIRGLAMGLALLMYGREGGAQQLIEQLSRDDNPILRYGGMFTIAMAYCGTGNTTAFEKLLHCAVSDVHDDVRRAAVIGLGFVMFRNPSALCRTIGLLNESYNAHVRYGAAMALGISCAGTALPEALDLLEPMTKDATDFVRQGAFIATAMVLVQHNDQSNPKVVAARKQYEEIITNKHQDAVSKFGASLASGIIDAGGRNVTMRLQSLSGSNNMQAIVGMAVFTQFWYWFPLAHFLSLSFTPTAIIGLNKNLDVPELEFVSDAKPVLFAYPPETPQEENKTAEKVETAVLSTTAKAKARAKKAEKEKADGDVMDTDQAQEEDKMDTDEKLPEQEETERPASPKKPEPTSETLSNFSRVVPWQLKHISFKHDSRYTPIKKVAVGVLMMKDRRPDEEVHLIELRNDELNTGAQSEEEAPMPEEFEYPPSSTAMSILSIGNVLFAQTEYQNSRYENLTFPTSSKSSRDDFLASLKGGEYERVAAINRHLHDKTIGRFDAEIIGALPSSVKLIANIGAGYDQIDVQAATERGIYVTNTPDAVRESTADTALFLLLAVTRNFSAGQAAVAGDEWLGVVSRGRDPSSLTVGVLGMGSIGQAFAERCRALSATLQYHNRSPSKLAPAGVTYVDFETLLKTSDVIMVSVPLNKGTTHILSTKEFRLMKKGSYLINTARGPIIDEQAMVDALDDGTLSGVGLDVFENEPKVHPGLKRPGCVLLPHMGTHTSDASKLMEVQSLENICDVLGGGRRNIVPEQAECHF